jgi:hypothetical protein
MVGVHCGRDLHVVVSAPQDREVVMGKTWQQRQRENRKIREDRNKRIIDKRAKGERRKLDNTFREVKRR